MAIRLVAALGCLPLLLGSRVLADPSKCEASMDKLNTSVRELVQQNCGSCHDGSLATANPAALKVFDLREQDWTARMSDEQVRKLLGRAKRMSAENQTLMAKFVNQVLTKRNSEAAAEP